MSRSRLKRKGFTLVELLIVVLVIAIIASIALIGYRNFTSSAKADSVLSVYNKVAKAAKMYSSDTDYYPASVQRFWKNDDGSGNPIPNWKGPYLEPPGGDTTLTNLPVPGIGQLTAQIICTGGGVGTGKVVLEFTGDGLTPKLANEVTAKLGSIATYDSTNNKLDITITKAEAVEGQHIYCK